MERYILVDTLSQHPFELENFPEAQDDDELVCIAVKKNGLALQFASDRLRNDKETVMIAVKKNGLALQFASEGLRNDKEAVMTAVNKEGGALRFVSNRLLHDREVIMTAIESDGFAFTLVPSELIDRDIVLAGVTNCGDGVEINQLEDFIPEELFSDVEIAKALVELDTVALAYIPDELLLNNFDIILNSLEEDSTALEYLPEAICSDREAMLKLVRIDSTALIHASTELQNDKELVLEAMRAPYNSYAYAELSSELRSDPDVLKTFVYNIDNDGEEHFSSIFDDTILPKELIDDEEFVKTVVWLFTEQSFEYNLFYNKDFVLRAIELCGVDKEYISPDLLDDPDVTEAYDRYFSQFD